MSFWNGILGGEIGAEALSLVKEFVEKHGGVEGGVAELEQTASGQQVKSWVGTGENLPVSADQIREALGSQKVKDLAAAVGISSDKVSDLLAQYLPVAIDKATPDGKLPTQQ